MSEFKKLKLKQYPQIQDRETSESKYWKSFQIGCEHKLLGSPNCIHFNPFTPDSFIVTASTKVSLYNSIDDKLQRAYSRYV